MVWGGVRWVAGLVWGGVGGIGLGGVPWVGWGVFEGGYGKGEL